VPLGITVGSAASVDLVILKHIEARVDSKLYPDKIMQIVNSALEIRLHMKNQFVHRVFSQAFLNLARP